MRVAYVGDYINHGTALQTAGTALVLLLSSLKDVELVDVYCPTLNEKVEPFEPPKNVKITEFYRYNDPVSILRLLNVEWKKYDVTIFNLLPTTFGDSSISNSVGLLIPLVISKLVKHEGIKVIYHNSVFTNDIAKLGYDSIYDKIRAFFLSLVEKAIFKNVDTYVLLNLYKTRIDKSIGKNRVKYLNARYLEAITTLYLNHVIGEEEIMKEKNDVPIVLMHGAWGPQKNIEIGLSALKKVKDSGVKFKLIISGGINHHFPEYEKHFREMLRKHADLFYQYLGPVPEKKIMELFTQADLLILPYNTPGGHSAVLEQGILFDVSTIAINFPEYREQVSGLYNIYLVELSKLSALLKEIIPLTATERKIIIKKKLVNLMENMQVLLK